MPKFTVVDPGFLTTVQDLGRPGLQQYGVPVGGALDTYSLRAGNRLLGNDDGAAALEMTMRGATLIASGETVAAVTGGKLSVYRNGKRVPTWEALQLTDGDRLALGEMEAGARAYLCVAGGIDVPLVMGSRATFLRGVFGGWHGRVLRASDVLPLGELTYEHQTRVGSFVPLPSQARLPAAISQVRVMLGPQNHLFPDDALRVLCSARYQVAAEADRMGCRLSGERLVQNFQTDTISDGVALGSIQVLGSGHPTIMLADRQTTGGYMKIATVISADLPLVGQMRTGDALQFIPVSYEEALQALQLSEEALRGMPTRALPKRFFHVLLRGENVRVEVSEV
ncbi:MAG: KipI antagonist [Firmicutes bacterium]|nr:KipI antagonist [Bacillota bacterium]